MHLFGRRRGNASSGDDGAPRHSAAEAEGSAMLSFHAGLFGQAEIEFQRAAALDPGSARVHEYLGLVQQRLGRLDDAEASLARAMALAPEDESLFRSHGTILEDLGRLTAAAADYRSALAADPGNALAEAALGSLLLRLGDLALAGQHLRRALELAPSDIRARIDLAELARHAGDTAEAVALLRQALALATGEAPVVMRYGATLGPAQTTPQQIARQQRRLGMLLLQVGQPDEAATLVRAAHAGAPSDPDILHDLAIVLVSAGHVSEALALYDRAGKTYPEERARYEADLATLLVQYGQAVGNTGDVPSSQAIGDAKPSTPTLAIPIAPAADQSALAQLEARVATEPQNRQLRRDLSVAYLRAGRVPDAKEQARIAEQMLGIRAART